MTVNEIVGAFSGMLPLSLRLLRESCGLHTLEFLPRPDSLLSVAAAPGATIKLSPDSVIAPGVLVNHSWQPEEIVFAKAVALSMDELDLVDVGANVGLFSRQLLAAVPNIRRSFCYEPDPTNFGFLAHNLRPFSSDAILANAALAATAGHGLLFKDPDNSGNFSLTSAAMPLHHGSLWVETRDTAQEARAWLQSGRRLFYKSDTQGYDELIATRLDRAFWDHVAGGIFEIWRIQKPMFDHAVFASILDAFPNKAFLSEPKIGVTTSTVMSYLQGTDGQFHDLAFWR